MIIVSSCIIISLTYVILKKVIAFRKQEKKRSNN